MKNMAKSQIKSYFNYDIHFFVRPNQYAKKTYRFGRTTSVREEANLCVYKCICNE